jgi:hypothetical protein
VYILPNGDRVPTGQVKPNDPEDPDYVPDELDVDTCPTTSTTTSTSTTTTTTTTTTLPPTIVATAEVTNNTLGGTWRAIVYLSAVVGVSVRVEGTFYVGASPKTFSVTIPAGMLYAIEEESAASIGEVATDVTITLITPNSYNGVPIEG